MNSTTGIPERCSGSINKTYITQSVFDNMVLELGRKVEKARKRFFNVIGIERGGVYVSKPLSKYLLADHRSIKISFYSKDNTVNIEPIYDFNNIDFNYLRNSIYPVLICDDLIDSGVTLNWFKNHTGLVQGKNFYIASLFHNKNNKYNITSDFYVNEKKESEWIVFPHEVHEELVASA